MVQDKSGLSVDMAFGYGFRYTEFDIFSAVIVVFEDEWSLNTDGL